RPAPRPAEPAPQSKFCPQCGTPYKTGARFCHQCGAERR
ncbi:MAG: zinc-ribbon domain-containing protein, partial [Caldilineae bacterium]